MNIAALKEFAPAVRRQLMEAVGLKLNHVLTARTPDYVDTYARRVAAIRRLAQEDRAGLIERVAYTWFNRLTALRFLDARGWHPFGVRVLTPATADEIQPELLKLMSSGHCPDELRSHTQLDRLNGLLDGRIPSANAQGEVYRHLVLAACRYYNALLPDVFEQLDDETELLLPEDLLTEQSVAQGFRTGISDEDCAEVEIIGWLYQFYISERKDEVMARKSTVPKEDIPAVTQLFTPHWIVRYLVENSLGRLWLLNRPESRLRERMPYYIEGEPEAEFLRITRPEEIRVLDPAAGSGHMLTYAFDLLYAIYEEEGYPASDIPAHILQHNLHGLDICPRAAQLAELALLFKAREKSRRFFKPENLVRPNVMQLREVHFSETELRGYIRALNLGELFDESLVRAMFQFEEAKNFGSLIHPRLDEQTIAFVRGTVEEKDLGSQLFLRETHRKVLRVLEQAVVLTQRYHVVVANPPYMGSGQMNPELKRYLENSFSSGKGDVAAAFMLRSVQLILTNGHFAMITFQNWMFISSFERLRSDLLSLASLSSLVHCGRGVWGADFGSCAFVFERTTDKNRRGHFRRLFVRQSKVQSNQQLESNYFDLKSFPVHVTASQQFRRIDGAPIAYWLTEGELSCFKNPPLKNFAVSGGRCKTHSDETFVRFLWEVGSKTLSIDGPWKFLAHGGDFRKWYGNKVRVFAWTDDARSEYASHGGLSNSQYWNKDGICWSDVTIAQNSFRIKPADSEYSSLAPTLIPIDPAQMTILLGFLNTGLANNLLRALNPTMHANVGDVQRLPFVIPDGVSKLVLSLVELARADWDSFETSWDFRDHPLLRPCLKDATLEASWRNWEMKCTSAIRQMQELETENNRLFIDAYGLQGELSPEVPVEQITLSRADARSDMVAFLSYAVGCIMGRYSLDHPGIILANTGDSMREYIEKVNLSQENLAFAPSEDGIIPMLDGEWFENDIVARTRDFLRATFGDNTLRENVRFIEDSLGKDLRKYFVTDFYKDHLQAYKRRPIYWMVQSTQKGFSLLIYLHRYTRDTMNLVLNRYLREYQIKLRSRIAHLAEVQSSSAVSTRDKSAARKEFNKLNRTLHECEDWERQVVLPLAQARIGLDLDDGVKVNYLKLGEALAPIPGLEAVED
jgi:N-6 DNA Methylase